MYRADEVVGLKLKQRTLHEKRREALNKILDIKGRIGLRTYMWFGYQRPSSLS